MEGCRRMRPVALLMGVTASLDILVAALLLKLVALSIVSKKKKMRWVANRRGRKTRGNTADGRNMELLKIRRGSTVNERKTNFKRETLNNEVAENGRK